MKVIKAKFKPKSLENLPGILVQNCMNGGIYNFVYAYTLGDGSEYYEPDDINFPSSNPINILDLEIIK